MVALKQAGGRDGRDPIHKLRRSAVWRAKKGMAVLRKGHRADGGNGEIGQRGAARVGETKPGAARIRLTSRSRSPYSSDRSAIVSKTAQLLHLRGERIHRAIQRGSAMLGQPRQHEQYPAR